MIRIKTFVDTIVGAICHCMESILSTALGLIFALLYPVLLDCIMACSSFMNNAFGMSPDQFNRIFPVVKDFQNQLYGLGIALTVGLFILALFKNIFSGLGFEAENPGKMICRFFIAIFLVLWLNPILNLLFTTVFNVPYKDLQSISAQKVNWGVLTTPDVKSYGATADKIFKGLFTATVIKGFGHASSALAEEIMAFVMILMVAIGYFKLAVEIAERYLMVNVLILFSPLVASSVVLESTLNIFKAFFRMFIGQLILLWTNAICLGMTDSALASLTNDISNANGNNGMIDLVALLAFLYIAQHMDNYLRDLGVNIGITGGGMVSEFMATAGMAKGILKTAGKVGKGTAHGIAGAAGTIGGLSGKKEPASTGNSSVFSKVRDINNANNKGVQLGSNIRNSKLGKTLHNLGSQSSQKRPAANVQKSSNASMPKSVPKPKSVNDQKQKNIGGANTNKAAALNKDKSNNPNIAANTSKSRIPLTKGNIPETGILKPANTNNPALNNAKHNAAAIPSPANTNGPEQQMVNPIDKGATTESAQEGLPVSNDNNLNAPSTGGTTIDQSSIGATTESVQEGLPVSNDNNAGLNAPSTGGTTINQSSIGGTTESVQEGLPVSNDNNAGLNAPSTGGTTINQSSIGGTTEQSTQNGLPVSNNNNTSYNQPKISQQNGNANSVQPKLPKKYTK